MDVLLLGAAAVLLLLLTIWIVWRPGVSSNASAPQQEEGPMIPQGDEFEDQYTSATADLSAGGVALAEAAASEHAAAEAQAPAGERPQSAEGPFPTGGPRWAEDVPQLTGSATGDAPIRRTPQDDVSRGVPGALVLGAAALCTLSGAVGVWLYARWQRERNKPLNRLRRRLR